MVDWTRYPAASKGLRDVEGLRSMVCHHLARQYLFVQLPPLKSFDKSNQMDLHHQVAPTILPKKVPEAVEARAFTGWETWPCLPPSRTGGWFQNVSDIFLMLSP